MSRTPTIADLANPREVAFVAALFELGGPQHGAAAALRAGYARDEAEAGRVAVHLLSSPRISAAIAGETKARFEAATATAFRALVDICAHGRSESARISAAQEILNRGIGPIPSRSFSVAARTSIEDMLDLLGQENAHSGNAKESGTIDHDPGAADSSN